MTKFLRTHSYKSTNIIVALVTMTLASGAQAALFSDDFESGAGLWSTSGGWGLTTSSAHSPTRAMTDSPGTFYANNSDATLTLTTPLNLSGTTRPALRFYHRYEVEPNYDWISVEASSDGGATWSALSAYTGTQATWNREQLSLAAYAGLAAVKIRFRLVSDASVVMDGWYLDDLLIGEVPEPPVLTNATPLGVSAVALAWEPSPSANVTAYRVYRYQSATFDWHTALLLGETTAEVTQFTDIAAAPKATFRYRVMAVTAEGLHAISGELAAVLPPGMDYPFLDTAEAGGTYWIAEGGWARSGEEVFSGSRAWSDSPGALYANSINASLRLAAPFSLSSAVAPVLTFQQKHNILSGDSGVVEISVNNGADWTVLKTFANSTSTNAWTNERFSLAAYVGKPAVLLRFRLTTNASGQGDGWWIDDISVAEAPTAVPSLLIDQVTSHTLRLSWPQNNDTIFSHYAIHRVQAATGATRLSPCVATIPDQAQTTWSDSKLALNTEYTYRVYAVSPYGAYSTEGPEAATRTLNNPLPFADGFEDGGLDWNFGGAWGITTEDSASGAASLTDSPLGLYSNNLNGALNYALTAVDLRGATWPVLTFKDRHALYAPSLGDWGILSVSADGNSWIRLYSVCGERDDWAEQQIDLSRWRGQANLRLRFELHSDGANAGDGWFIDDVSVTDHAPAGFQPLPFVERFEDGLTNWFNGGWVSATNTPYEGMRSAEGFPGRWMVQNRDQQFLTLARPFDLSGATAPQITFWGRRSQGNDDARIHLYLSRDNGLSWWSPSGHIVREAQWVRYQYAIPAEYRMANVRLAFGAYAYYNVEAKLQVDKLTVEEMPPAVTLATPVPQLKSVALSWSAYSGAAFQRYEIYRRASAGVTWNDTKIATLTDINATTFNDSGLSIGKSYYYKVFVINANDTYTPSNEAGATTVPVSLPFADAINDLSLWDVQGAWGVETNGTEVCLTDSPGVQYANSQNGTLNYALTAVDLRDATWPVLTFKDRHALYASSIGDWGILSVSSDGNSWIRLYSVCGERDDWAEQQIDLSRWRGQANLRIRFELHSDGANAGDGWFIDDVSVTDHAPSGSLPLPFAERFEDGLTNWFNGGWVIATNTPYEGMRSAEGFPVRWMVQNRDQQFLTLARPFDLSGATAPQITFWGRRSQGNDDARIHLYLSRDNGLSWWSPSGHIVREAQWVRYQYAIPAEYRMANVRLAFGAYAYYNVEAKLQIDKLTVEETPPAVTLATPVPQLKSVALSWSAYSGAAFQRYEIYRRASAGVTWNDTKIATLTDINATTFNDSGLSIGKSYYYKVFVVNANDTYTPSNEAVATTVPVSLPFADAISDLSYWDVQGAWGVETNGTEVCLTDSPGVQYANNLNGALNYALTAVDLTGVTWPVLTFKDRHALYAPSLGDWGILSVSADGNSWIRLYSVCGERADWAEQQIDLSRWRGQANLRLRFELHSDWTATAGDGWFIDDVSVTDHAPAGSLPLPFVERFEDGLTNWFNGGWVSATNTPYEGFRSAEAFPCRWMVQNRDQQFLTLTRPFDLSGAVAPQITFWGRRSQGDDNARIHLYLSKDNGLSWWSPSGHIVREAQWIRYQYAIPADYRVANVRLAFGAYAHWDVEAKLQIDKLTVEETPPAVTLATPVDVEISGMTLGWSAYEGAAFQCYKVFRHTAQNVNESHTLLATISDPGTTNLLVDGLSARTRYFYKVYIYNESDTGTPSNEASAQTLGVPIGWSDNFESAPPDALWTFTGTWGLQAGVGVEGSTALTDSPGDYANNGDTWAQTAVDLSTAAWPVLTFKDRHALPPSGDNAYLQIGAADNNNIASITWTTVYSIRESRADWREQQIDLSRWKGRHTVYIRFRLGTDGSVVNDGWVIDNVALREHAPLPQALSLYERFEGGLTNWINGGWGISAVTPYEGGACVLNHQSQIVQAGTDAWMVYGGELDLRNATSAKVTLWSRGWRGYANYGSLNVCLSKDGGATWLDLTGALATSETWTRFQYAVPAAYQTNGVRVAIQSYAYRYDLESKHFIDAFGVGSETPGAPTPLSPVEGATVTVLRPLLQVANAVDSQNDPLTYSFEVYSSETLSSGSLVAQNPAIASGASTTAWQVDVELVDQAQYWWRCRASDSGRNVGPWSATATFFVGLVNTPPDAPILVAPSAEGTLPNADGWFVWFASSDADLGDAVVAYQLQIAADADFSNLLLASEIAAQPTVLLARLNDLSGYEALILNARYYWRVRALDTWGVPSVWSSSSFIYGTLAPEEPEPDPDPEAITITAITVADGMVSLSWTLSPYPVRIEFSPTLSPPQWTTVPGPIGMIDTSRTFPQPTEHPQCFFRIVAEYPQTQME